LVNWLLFVNPFTATFYDLIILQVPLGLEILNLNLNCSGRKHVFLATNGAVFLTSHRRVVVYGTKNGRHIEFGGLIQPILALS